MLRPWLLFAPCIVMAPYLALAEDVFSGLRLNPFINIDHAQSPATLTLSVLANQIRLRRGKIGFFVRPAGTFAHTSSLKYVSVVVPIEIIVTSHGDQVFQGVFYIKKNHKRPVYSLGRTDSDALNAVKYKLKKDVLNALNIQLKKFNFISKTHKMVRMIWDNQTLSFEGHNH